MFYFILWGFGPQGGEYFNIRLYFVAPYWDISSKFSSKSLIPTYIPASPPAGLTLIGALHVTARKLICADIEVLKPLILFCDWRGLIKESPR
jgi:hypothetical protein